MQFLILAYELILAQGACAPAAYPQAQRKFKKAFGVSAEITTLALSLYVLGFAVGPVLLAPL